MLETAQIPLLRNQLVQIPVCDGTLTLAGLDAAWGGNPDPSILVTDCDERILLAHHEPDHILKLTDEQRQKVALQVSGHTHGGQICLPPGIVLARVHMGRRFVRGHYDLGDGTQVYVNRGIGTMTLPARFACRPEITLLEIRNRARD